MMPRYFSKVGVWLFTLAFVWYLAGNYMLDHLSKERLAKAESMHVKDQFADLGGQTMVVLDTQVENRRGAGKIKLVFEPGMTQAKVSNPNLQIAVSMQATSDAFHIRLSSSKSDLRHYNSETIEIRLPVSVRKLELTGTSSAEISGSFPAPEAVLELLIQDCGSHTDIGNLQVRQLRLVSRCVPPPTKECCSITYSLNKDMQIRMLEVKMPFGNLDIHPEHLPQQILLDVGEDVTISGRRDFFKLARFVPDKS
ncbi:hypothetical protein ACO0LG_09285 [Undibacterium sp. Ji42W]|uniref:hypothetical protein n=1 Tax=Undibacterium sp. Ji42W TaxID=3413039 RepID=UPI003BF13032